MSNVTQQDSFVTPEVPWYRTRTFTIVVSILAGAFLCFAATVTGFMIFGDKMANNAGYTTSDGSCNLGGGQFLANGAVHPDNTDWMCSNGEIVPAPEGAFNFDIPVNEGFVPQGDYVTSCEGWNTNAGATNILHPGQTARLDGCADGACYFDVGGSGQGTSIRNKSSRDVTVTPGGDWGGGCENTVDLEYLIEKDLVNGCGTHCNEARIVTITDFDITDEVYTSVP